MPGSISSSDESLPFNGSASSFQSDEDIVRSQNGSRKRRRLSPAASDESINDPPKQALLSDLSTSRIKTKRSGPKSEIRSAPLSIEAATEVNEQADFATLDVDSWLVASLSHMAIKRPTRIQKGCIPEILKGRDCIGGSRTGSGKTVAFAVPILQQWARDPVGIFAVVLTPTRYVVAVFLQRTED